MIDITASEAVLAGEGLEKLLGERITLFCLNYIYTGKLLSVNATCALLSDATIVYQTGTFNDKHWKDAQTLPHEVYVMLACVESYMKCPDVKYAFQAVRQVAQ